MNLENIYNKIEESGTKVFSFGVDGIKAVTIEANDKYGIFLNPSEINDSNEEFCVLAHEYGHCASASTHRLYSSFDLICRHEYRADRRSVLEFAPIENIRRAFENGCQTIYEISEYLDLPEKFVEKAINHYSYMEMI